MAEQVSARAWPGTRCSPTARPGAALATPALLERLAPRAAVSARANRMVLPVDQVSHLVVASSSSFVASAPRQSEYPHVASHRYLEPTLVTALATETTRTADGVANRPEVSRVFPVEHRHGRTGHRVELARYKAGGSEERILFGQRVDGVVRVTDVPAHGHRRAYLAERELEDGGYGALKALVADYVAQGELLAAVPMTVPHLD
jgi:hypothetical protein